MDECGAYGRMFRMEERVMPDFLNTTLSAAFFDIREAVCFVLSGCCLGFGLGLGFYVF